MSQPQRARPDSFEGTPAEALMVRFAAGDDAAFTPLFEWLTPGIRAFFLQSFLETMVADSLLPTMFRELHRGRDAYRPDTPLKVWVFGVAARVRQGELRRRYRLAATASEADIEKAETDASRALPQDRPARRPQPTSRLEAARSALSRLPESQRVVVYLQRHEELTVEQIAQALGATEELVRGRALAAYERLRRELHAFLRHEQDDSDDS